VSILVDSVDGFFTVNTEDGTKSSSLPIERGGNDPKVTVSPDQRYITYLQNFDSYGVCAKQWGQDIWTISSLLNLTADLRVVKNKSVVKLNGIASDKNFAGYRLEYADINSPNSWSLIMPPSDVPVVNSAFTDWIPPHEGSFLVRLTVWDQAGNQAVDRKTIAWGRSSSITNMYLSKGLFSPNGDRNYDTVELNYRVVEPVHVEFSVVNSSGMVVRTFIREHVDRVSTSIEWDGRDEARRIVPDGKYVIKLFDYEFPVEVDMTQPDVAISIGSPEQLSFILTGHAVDTNLKEWVVEFGEGDNPSEWQVFRSGQDTLAAKDETGQPILIPKVQAANLDPKSNGRHEWTVDDLIAKTGMRFRITATDFAGNSSSQLTEVMPELLNIYQLDTGGVSSAIYLIDVAPGPHTFKLFETIRAPLKNMRLQYKLQEVDTSTTPSITKYSWVDSGTSVLEPSMKMESQWNPSSTPINAVALRFVATIESGLEYFSNEIELIRPKQPDDKSPVNIKCQQITFFVDHGQAGCGQLSGNITYNLDAPIFDQYCDLPEFVKVSVYVVKPDKSEQLLKMYTPGQPEMSESELKDSLITSNYPEGIYKLKLIADYHRSNSTRIEHEVFVDNMFVDRVLPQGVFLAPTAGQMVCPVTVSIPFEELYAVDMEGMASDNTYPASYNVEYGVGENPDKWYEAETKFGSKILVPGASASLSGSGPINGRLGLWDVTGLLGKTVSTRLRVTDVAGNTYCTNRSFSIRNKPELKDVVADKRLFASLHDKLNVSYAINDDLTVSANVYTVNQDNTKTYTTSIFADRQQGSGVQKFEWDGRDLSGALLRDGQYIISITVKSACGMIVSDSSILVEIDNTVPNVLLTYPLEGNPVPLGNMIEVMGSSIDLHFFAYNLEAGEGESPETWRTIMFSQTPVTKNVLGVWNTYGMSGIWTLRLRATDIVGNESSVTSVFDLGLRKELVKSFSAAPRVFSPNNDQKLDASTISYEVTDACNLKIEIMDVSGKVLRTYTAITTTAGKGNVVWDGKNSLGYTVSDGVYTVRLVASLVVYSQVTQTEVISLTVDTTAPVITFSDLTDKSFLNRTDLSIVGTINDANLVGYSISVAGPSGTSVLDSGNQNRSGYYFGSLFNMAEDTYTLTIDASDQGENQVKSIRTFTIDRTPPKVTLDTPKSGEFYGAGKNVIDISGSVVEKNLDRYNLRYGVGESPIEWKELVGGDIVPTTSRLFSWKVGKDDGITDGVYTLSLYAKDKAGLEGETKVKLVVDNTLPEVAITQPIIGSYLTKATDIKGTLNDTNLDNGLLELAEGGCASAAKWAAVKSISASIQNGVLDSWKILPIDGEYCLRLSAVDKTGNKAETKIGFKIDTQPPSPPQLTGMTEGKTTNSLSWTKSPETDTASYNVYRNGQKLNTAPITNLFYSDADLKEGSYIYTVKAVDLAGNESAPSNAVTLKIDLTGPTVRISTPKDGTAISNLVDVKGTAYSQDDFKEYRVYIGQGSSPSSWTLIRRSPLPISFGSLAQWDTITSQEGSQYTIKLEGEDTSGNISTTQAIVTIDNTPPNAPKLDQINAPPSNDVILTWQANALTEGVIGYLLYRNNQLANVTGIVAGNLKPYLLTGTTYTDKALPDGTYSYYLVAMDQAGNISPQSDPAREVIIDTHPPHMTITEPANGFRFEATIPIKAETPDNDIDTVQFQYKHPQDPDTAWTDLGQKFVKAPYIAYFDPKANNLSYGDFQLRAFATDQHYNVDRTPQVVTVTYADLTPPDVPSGLAARVIGADVNLTWTAVSEADVSYNIYRWSGGTKSKANSVPVKTTPFTDADVPDGTYQYEITAIDVAGNESKASGQVSAKIYAPIITQPFTPVKESALNLTGSGVDPGAPVQMTTTLPSGATSSVTVNADSTGAFRLEGATLVLGENRFTATATDSAGNISRSSETIVVVYDVPPNAPTGLAAAVQGYDVQLTWDRNHELVLGYNVYRDGNKLNQSVLVTDGQATDSYNDFYIMLTVFRTGS
jgi:flagellar hook assembly protein FlgD/fibronectin type 3 domain-containing protein